MLNCVAGILGSKSCKTDLNSSYSSAESLWNTTSILGSPRMEMEGEIARYHFLEVVPICIKADAKSQHQRDKTIPSLNSNFFIRFQVKNTYISGDVRAIFFLLILYPSALVCLVALVMSDSLQPNGLYIAHQAPLSMGLSRQEHWSGMPCPPPGDLPNPGIEPVCLMTFALADGFFTTSNTWKAHQRFT